jgi:hypothetical protein
MEENDIRYELYIEGPFVNKIINRQPYQSCATKEKAQYIAKRDLKGKRWFIVKTERTVVERSHQEE